MSVIIRLQNLPWSANATDIRQFFKGLGIPDGGVHIVGGENGDAFIAFATDDDARKAMRLDGGKLKEIQVRLFLSSRAEMQEVIETARQTTISMMQMQRPPTIAAPTIPVPAILTPQSPPQTKLATAIQQKIPPILPTQLPGLITQQMYQQQIQQLQQQNPGNALNGLPPKTSETLDLVSSRRSRRSRSRSHSRSYSRSRSRSRSPSRSRERYRRRSRSPRRNKGRSHRDRSDSRDRDRRRNRTSVRNDKDLIGRNGNGNDKRSSAEIESKPAIAHNQIKAMSSLYQQNVPFSSNISQYMMKQMQNNANPLANNSLGQSEQISAFSTNDVRTMNMNMSLQTNPLAFQQQLYNQQQAVSMPAFNTFSQAGGVLQNPQQQQQLAAGMAGHQINKFSMNNMNQTGNNNMGGGTHCVRVRNLCNLTNYSAIRKFFAGLLIPNDGIKMINDSDGNRTGQAYVRFARPHFVHLACQRSNQKLGRNIIKIEELDEKMYDDAIDAYRPPRRNNYRERDHDRDRDRRYRRDYSDDDDGDDDDRTSSKGNSDNDRDNDVMCISDSNDSKESTPFTTVLIEDLPPFTKEQDIMKLFSSYPLVHIVMAKRPKMFSSYVRFHSADDAKVAVKNTACHKISFKTVYISQCSEEEFETARKEFSGELDLDIGMPKQTEENSSSSNDKNDPNEIKSPDTSILNHDYPNDESNDDLEPLTGVSLENIPGVNLNDPRINPAKFPFLKNVNADAKHTERIDPRTKTAVMPPMSTFNGVGMDAAVMAQQQTMMDMGMSEVCCILIENMEYRTTEVEIVEWIQSKCHLIPIRIQLLVNERNQTNGSGFIQFANNEQATKAMELLDKMQFKSRVVHISLASWQHIMMTIESITQTLRENGFDGIDTSGNIPRPPRYNNNNNNSNSSSNSNNNSNNNANNRFQNNNRFHNGHNRVQNNRQNNRNGNNTKGCIVSMSNVPYKATIEDILDFFSDFDVNAEDIMRRYNDEGKPTGDARIRFESPSEARRAIDLRDKCRLTNRPVYLQLFNH